MTCTLILIRHAKSDWGDPGLHDHDRPLNARGRDAAPRIGAWLDRQDLAPRTVLCSTARRTRDTWAAIARKLDTAPDPILTREIYEAHPAAILDAIRGCTGTPLAVIGHNPGIGSLANALCDTPPDHPGFASYPTGATTVLHFDAPSWDRIAAGQGRVIGFTVPRDLPQAD